MADVLADGSSGSYDIVPPLVGGLGFDPTDANAWAQAVGQAANGFGGAGNIGTFAFGAAGAGTTTFTLTVRPFASLLDTVPGTLYVYTRDANGNPTVLTFPVGGTGLIPQTFNISYGNPGTTPIAGSIFFTIVPNESSGKAVLSGGARLLNLLGVLSKKVPFGSGGALPSAGYNVQVFSPSVAPRSGNDTFSPNSLASDLSSADDQIVTGSVTQTDVQDSSTGATVRDDYVDNSLGAEFIKDESGADSALIYNAQTTQDVAVWASDKFDVNTDLQGQPHLTIVASAASAEVDFSVDPTIKMAFGELNTQSSDDQTTVQNIETIAGSSSDEVTLYDVYRVKGSSGNDVFDVDLTGISGTPLDINGNGGSDILNFQGGSGGLSLTLATTSSEAGPELAISGNGMSGDISAVQTINLAGDNNTVLVNSASEPISDATINLGATSQSSNETLDFTAYNGNVYLGSTNSADGSEQAMGLFGSPNMTGFTGLSFAGVTDLKLGAGDDKIEISEAADPFLKTIDTGDGNDTVSVATPGVTVDLGTGTNTLKSSGPGDIVKAG